MKALTSTEADTLANLLRRAIANHQLSLHVASPYENDVDWRRDGWSFNDRHDGNAVIGEDWHVNCADDVTEEDAAPVPTVEIYVDDESLCFLACSMTRRGLNRAVDLANNVLAATAAEN